MFPRCRITDMEFQVAVAKVGKYASSESGDTLEMIERPGGGLSFVLTDGQRSGKSAKAISNIVTRKAISLLADGVRDGAAARAASDYLYTYRSGKVIATLNILSIDLASRSLVITRNNPAPVVLIDQGKIRLLDAPSEAVGSRHDIRPSIFEVPLDLGLTAVVYSDGLVHAGDRRGRPMDIVGCLQELLDEEFVDPAYWADHLLDVAIKLDDGRPGDDISVLVGTVLPHSDKDARRLTVCMPL
jgi:serine phosphatase RsbU (regulator of sigma subunit)